MYFSAHYFIVLFRKTKYGDIHTQCFDNSKSRQEKGEKKDRTKVKKKKNTIKLRFQWYRAGGNPCWQWKILSIISRLNEDSGV